MPTHPASVMSRIVPLLFALLLSAAATAQSSDADRLRGYAEADGVVNFFDDNHISAALSRQLKSYFTPSIRGLIDQFESGEQARPKDSTPVTSDATPAVSAAP